MRVVPARENERCETCLGTISLCVLAWVGQWAWGMRWEVNVWTTLCGNFALLETFQINTRDTEEFSGKRLMSVILDTGH